MRCRRLIFTACLFLMLPLGLAAQSAYLDKNADAIEGFLQRNFAGKDSGMVIGLIDESGTRIFSGGGFGDGTARVVDGNAVFELGSVTKVFTSLLLVDAVHRGEMNFSDPVSKYMPEGVKAPVYQGKEITLLNLAVQDSGLPWHTPRAEAVLKFKTGKPDFKALMKESSRFSVEKLYTLLPTLELNGVPGERFQYSNVGMALLGHAIERATGKDYESLVIERICTPLGMNDTRIALTEDQKSRLAHGHMKDGSKADFWKFQAMKPAGGFLSTANDMLKLLAANLGINDCKLTPLMRQTHVNRHSGSKQFGRTAMPWTDDGVYNPPNSNLIGHAGGGVGTIAFVAMDTNNQIGVVVLTNQTNVYPNPIGWTLVQQMPFTDLNTKAALREVVGFGIVFDDQWKGEGLRIRHVMDKSSAARSGLKSKMLITKIDDQDIDANTAEQTNRLRDAPQNTNTTLRVLSSDGTERTIQLTKLRFLMNGIMPTNVSF